MTPVQKAIGAIFAAISTVGGAIWVCLSIIDRNDANVREQSRIELTINSLQKDLEKLDSREWKDWSQLQDEQKQLRSEILAMREKLLTIELRPK